MGHSHQRDLGTTIDSATHLQFGLLPIGCKAIGKGFYHGLIFHAKEIIYQNNEGGSVVDLM